MNRSYPTKITNFQLAPDELSKKTAIHESGHAAAIYFSNKEKQLPPIYFQIYIHELNNALQTAGNTRFSHTQFYASVDGGRLIHTLPSCMHEATRHFSDSEKQAYERAFEADIINLLVGPLAEAKYVALRDNELMTPRLVDLNALHFYGGSTDLKIANEYLDCLTVEPFQKEKKMAELFLAAYRFINHRAHWQAIINLADYILSAGKNIIDCEEIIAVLDSKAA